MSPSAPRAVDAHSVVHKHETLRFGRDNGIVGYWGPVSSSVDWCESNYVVSYHIAEFFNSVSNVFVVVMGLALFFIARSLHLDTRYKVASLFLSLVGLGSFAFHGTLLYGPQMLDELPMIYIQLCFFYIVMENSSRQKKYPWLPHILWLTGIIYSVIHAWYRLVVIFHILFALLTIPLIILPVSYSKHEPRMRKVFIASFVCLSVSWIGWKLDNVLCDVLEHFYLHALWHAGTSISAYLWLTCAFYLRLKYAHGIHHASLQFWRGVVPYVATSPVSLKIEVAISSPKKSKEALTPQSADSSAYLLPSDQIVDDDLVQSAHAMAIPEDASNLPPSPPLATSVNSGNAHRRKLSGSPSRLSKII